MSPELETLDQLLSGNLSLALIRNLYPDAEAFERGVLGLLRSGDVVLRTAQETEVPSWRWRELFVDGRVAEELNDFQLEITEQGAKRV